MAWRPCLDCGRPQGNGPRCKGCTPKRARRDIDATAWKKLRTQILAAWRADYGDWCPGSEDHAAHVAADLTVDHIVSRARGGALLDPSNLRVLCRRANSARGVGS